MFLRCLGHERLMFGMFLTCFKPQNTCRNHIFVIFVDFSQQYAENGFFRLKKYFQTHVNQNTLCRLVCVSRTDMRQRPFESHDLRVCNKYPRVLNA